MQIRDFSIVQRSLLVVALAMSFASASFGSGETQVAVDRADRFLSRQSVGKDVLAMVHMGAEYHGHTYVKTMNIVDSNDKPIDGYFALVYQFKWENDGLTNVAFLCDASGTVYDVRVIATNAVLQQPFLAANAAIQVVADLVLNAPNTKLSDADRRAIQNAVDSADAKSLLKLMLAVRQAA